MDFTITARILLQSVYILAVSLCYTANTCVWCHIY